MLALSGLSLALPTRASATPVFRVGAAVLSVKPQDPGQKTHVGGFGDCHGCGASGGTTRVRALTGPAGEDALAVRAIYISDGHTANVMVSAPFEGWFAGYQQGARLGITELRQEAAAALSGHGGLGANAVTESNIIVSTIHCHACPTVVGLWGPTNVAYLHFVYDQALAAIEQAQAAAAPATLTWATGDIGYGNDVTVGQANANEGWPIDGQLSVLEARSTAVDRHVVGTYMTVPIHGNIVYGPDLGEMQDEHFGAAARYLEAHLGGVAVVAAGGLGDQTSPMQGDDFRLKADPRGAPPGDPVQGYPEAYDVVDRLGALTASTAIEALARRGHALSDGTLSGAEMAPPAPLAEVPASNPLILGLSYGHALPDTTSQVTHDGKIAGQQTDDRAILPPYATGNLIGVWFTVLRIGEVAIASEPGEAFPHVSSAIREALTNKGGAGGAAAVFIVGNAQDQLGYFFEAWAYPGTFYYSADHYLYNVGLTLAEQNIQAETQLGAQLGYTVATSTAGLTDATQADMTRYFLYAGTQGWAYPRGIGEVYPPDSGSQITVPIGLYSNSARSNESGLQLGEQATGPPTAVVQYADGSRHPVSTRVSGTSDHIQYGVFTFPCAGAYRVLTTFPGTQARWESIAHVYSATHVTNTAFYPTGTGPHPLALDNLHDGPVSTCQEGSLGDTSHEIGSSIGAKPNAPTGSGLPNTSAQVPTWLSVLPVVVVGALLVAIAWTVRLGRKLREPRSGVRARDDAIDQRARRLLIAATRRRRAERHSTRTSTQEPPSPNQLN